MKVKKAIIPAAGFGSRMLPATKAIPKEMLPIVDKPTIQYIVEEVAASGVEDILIVTSRGKGAVEDHFDRLPELEDALRKSGRDALYNELLECTRLANIVFTRQLEITGSGDAILKGRSFVGDEPFLVLYGDDVIISDIPVSKQLIDVYGEFELPCLGIQQVPLKDITKYSSMKVAPIRDNLYMVDDMVEKPAIGEHFSQYAILGRLLLTPDIFSVIENQAPGAGGEIQITDSIRTLANRNGCIGVDFVGKRYDIGNKFGYLRAQIEVGLSHPETGEELRAYLKSLEM
ncbi:MAG: UTP--glucose-1-phosphate uridylyltransferase [Oscillospiraceae bacterium]|nr:UTP--glucose-1-phosphate uridylyltransferase [Oscillospiraceae bacterium]